ncbi:MAG TPA: hypothetical protein ENK51_10455 [Gammaproteobacteria bacterium]|nr:hypothetical protein [Gammaproteobacteria bacterium]
MRLVFWLFLLLNLAFFYWQYSQPQPVDAPLLQTEAVPAGVDRLVLLRERGLASPSQSEPAAGPPAAVSSSVVTEPEPEAALAQKRQDAMPVPGPLGTEGRSQPEPEPAPPPAPAEPPPPPVMACFTLGPLKDESEAGRLYKALRALDIMPEQRLSERRAVRGYWVYLPPLKSYADARDKVQALQKKGLDDMYVMGKGEMKNAISLGLFTRKSTATERFNQVRRLEPATMMKPRYRRIKERWLDVRVDGAHSEMLARLAALAEDFPGVELVRRKACK